MLVFTSRRARTWLAQPTIATFAGAFALAAAWPAWAQVPSTVDPGQIQRELDPPRQQDPIAPSAPTPSIGKPQPLTPEGAENLRFVLTSASVVGSSVYAEDELLADDLEKVGSEISVADLFEMAASMTARYRNDGYLLSSVIVPPQKIDDGSVTFQVVEGFIDRVLVDGVRARSQRTIYGYLDNLIGERPLRKSTLERYLLLVDDLPGVQVKSFIEPSPDNGGAAVLSVKADVEKYSAWSRLDNRGSDFVGPFQHEVGGVVNALGGVGQSLTARAIATPQQFRELQYVDLTFAREIDKEGTAIVLSARRLASEPGEELEVLELESTSIGADISIRFKPVRAREENLFFDLKASFDNSETDALGELLSEDKSRYVAASGQYQFADRFLGATSLSLTINRGLSVMGATPEGDPLASRSDAVPDATWAEVYLSRLQGLEFIVPGVSVQASVSGQYSLNPLSAAREFGVGGRANASAFDSSEIAGEHGVSGRLELRYSTALPMMDDIVPGGFLRGTGVQVYAFGDGGQVWQEDGGLTGQENDRIASAGVGARFNIGENISGSVEVAQPFIQDVGSQGNRDPRVFFELVGRF